MAYLKIYQWERATHPWAFEPMKHYGIEVFLLRTLNPLTRHFKVRRPGVGFADLGPHVDAEYISEAIACVRQLLNEARAIRRGGGDARYAQRLEYRAASFRNGRRLNGNDIIAFNTDAPPTIGLLLHEFAHHVCWHAHGHQGHRSPFPRVLRDIYTAYINIWEPERAVPAGR